MSWEIVVGLEVHAQLVTQTKAFCRCPNRYGAPPNTLTCPRCLGMPGALPVLNREVVRQATKLAMAMNCTIHPHSKFDRKNYFYPDLPKGYQISQYDEPFSSNGYLDIDVDGTTRRIGITRAHIEEDAGKSMHQLDGTTVVDMNRCGVPLVEIVSEPDLRSPAEAAAYLNTARELLRFIGVCDGNMERGSLRCDANISVRREGEPVLNERCEIKNLNSIRNVERAIRAEAERQIAIYNSGGEVLRQTMLWDEETEEPRPMRRKEGSDDYRYFPEPDLMELEMTPAYLGELRKEMPELPRERKQRYREQLSLHDEAVSLLGSNRALGDYFEELMRAGVDARAASNWVQGEVQRVLLERDISIEDFSLSARSLAELINAVGKGAISNSLAKDVFRKMLNDGRSAAQIIEAEGLAQVSDADELRALLANILSEYPDDVQRYRSGKRNLMGFFMGEAMKATGGRANPKMLSGLLQEMLNGE